MVRAVLNPRSWYHFWPPADTVTALQATLAPLMRLMDDYADGLKSHEYTTMIGLLEQYRSFEASARKSEVVGNAELSQKIEATLAALKPEVLAVQGEFQAQSKAIQKAMRRWNTWIGGFMEWEIPKDVMALWTEWLGDSGSCTTGTIIEYTEKTREAESSFRHRM